MPLKLNLLFPSLKSKSLLIICTTFLPGLSFYELKTNPDFYFQSKTRKFFCDFGSGFNSMFGGEIKGLSKLTRDVRNELISEAKEQVGRESYWRPYFANFNLPTAPGSSKAKLLIWIFSDAKICSTAVFLKI